MQAVAREMQVSDTAFLDEFNRMRTFTHDGEVDYSVRGALACAYLLKEMRGHAGDRISIETRARSFSVDVGEW